MKKAVSFVHHLCIPNSVIESDSKQVIEATKCALSQGLEEMKLDLRTIIEDIYLMLNENYLIEDISSISPLKKPTKQQIGSQRMVHLSC